MQGIHEIFPTSVSINGIPVESMNEFEIHLSRGVDPWIFTVVSSDNRFDGLENPVTIELSAPDRNLVAGATLTLYGWHLVMSRPVDPGRTAYTFADARWRASYNKFSGSFNMVWADGTPWESRRWTCVQAAEYAMERFGLRPDIGLHDISDEMFSKELPNNLGNTEEGGFHSASMHEVFPKLLEPIRADLIITPSGNCRIVGRSDSNSNKTLRQKRIYDVPDYSMIGGSVGERVIRWQVPREIVVQFRRKIEGVFYFAEEGGGRTFARPLAPKIGMLQNVARDPDGDFRNFGEASGEWTRGWIGPGSAVGHMRRFWFRPELFPFDAVPENLRSAPDWAGRVIDAEEQLRMAWRRYYRVDFTDEPSRACSRIRLGRLDEGGGTLSAGGVLCDYTTVHDAFVMTRREIQGPSSRMMEGTLSQGRGFTVSPFQAVWADEDERVFVIVPTTSGKNTKIVFPGLFESDMTLRLSLTAVESGETVYNTVRSSPIISAGFKAAVYWNGYVVRPFGWFYEREHSVSRPAHGAGPRVFVPAGDMTANFRLTGGQTAAEMEQAAAGGGSYELLNNDEVQARATEVAQAVLQTYEQGTSGVATCGGVHAIASGGIITGGPIHNTIIQFGGASSYSITTHYEVVPERRPGEATTDKLDGVAPERLL